LTAGAAVMTRRIGPSRRATRPSTRAPGDRAARGPKRKTSSLAAQLPRKLDAHGLAHETSTQRGINLSLSRDRLCWPASPVLRFPGPGPCAASASSASISPFPCSQMSSDNVAPSQCQAQMDPQYLAPVSSTQWHTWGQYECSRPCISSCERKIMFLVLCH